MNLRIGMPLIGILALAACAPKSSIPSGSVVFDEDVALMRAAKSDHASREVMVDADSIIVAVVDERLTDVRVKLTATGANAGRIKPVEVTSNLAGSGLEIATIEAPRDS